MTGEPFSLQLRRAAEPIWAAQLAHPFVRGIADGSLPLEHFRHWVRQDYLFLIDYCRLLAIAAARAPDLATMGRFADLLKATLGTEMELHRGYAAELGIPRDELEREIAGPTTRGYVDFLLRTAALGDYVELAPARLIRATPRGSTCTRRQRSPSWRHGAAACSTGWPRAPPRAPSLPPRPRSLPAAATSSPSGKRRTGSSDGRPDAVTPSRAATSGLGQDGSV